MDNKILYIISSITVAVCFGAWQLNIFAGGFMLLILLLSLNVAEDFYDKK